MKRKTYKIAYNVYTGKFWNGFWFCTNRKGAVPIDVDFLTNQRGRLVNWNTRIHTVKR